MGILGAQRSYLCPTVQLPALVGYISGRTGLNESKGRMVPEELSDAVMFFNLRGPGVKLVRLGAYLPKISLDGKFGAYHRLDREIRNALNAPGAFSGDVANRANIGKTADELVALWNVLHPEDSVQT